jgi:hypothetical protein
MVALVQLWSVIVKMVLYSLLPDFGNFVMKSIATVWKGRECSGVMGTIPGLSGLVFALFAWQTAHPLMYCSTSCFIYGHQTSHFASSYVLVIPGCPADGCRGNNELPPSSDRCLWQ